MSFTLLGILNSQAAGGAEPALEHIESIMVTAIQATSIEFTGIPADYKHLQIRGLSSENGGNFEQLGMQLNGDTGNSYGWHRLQAAGSSVFSETYLNRPSMFVGYTDNVLDSPEAESFAPHVIDIYDYTNPSKNTTIKALNGYINNTNASRRISFSSGHWRNTSTVNSVKLYIENGSALYRYTRFALYGIRG